MTAPKTWHCYLITAPAPVIAWWSGGVTSAVTCKICINWFGAENVRVVFIDTKNESPDTYRFMADCERWYGTAIETTSMIGNEKGYNSIRDVWRKFKSLNTANGAICSSVLKREARERFQRTNAFSYQAFGFDRKEIDRAVSMKTNYPVINPIFPLIVELLDKKGCIKILENVGIEIPEMYKMGFSNNNCWNTGCVQGDIGYWQLMQKLRPEIFDAMAEEEHLLTNLKGQPVTMLKDQSKNGGLVFLKPHPDYPLIKDISMMKGRPPKPLLECNGFCGVNDLSKRSSTEKEINFHP